MSDEFTELRTVLYLKQMLIGRPTPRVCDLVTNLQSL
jgi:hypothetical protein